jgi:hypothetical protein
MKKPEVRSNARNAFERTQCVRTQTRSHAEPEDERSPVSPRLTEPALAVICGRPCAVRSTVDNRHVRTHALRSNAGPFSAAYK